MGTRATTRISHIVAYGLLSILLICVARQHARAEQLPARTYTVADGLAHDQVRKILRDSHGFLWFCTIDGLTRFDGRGFTTYSVREGLPVADVTDIIEARDGAYWVATNDGAVSRFTPSTGSRLYADSRATVYEPDNDTARDSTIAIENTRRLFTTFNLGDSTLTNGVNVLYEDAAGRVWAGGNGGLFCLESGEREGFTFRRVSMNIPSKDDRVVQVNDITEDHEGSLWVATVQGMVRRLPDGRTLHYALHLVPGLDIVWSIMVDDENRLWIGYQAGLIVFKPEPAARAVKTENLLGRVIEARRKSAPKIQATGRAPHSLAPLPTSDGDVRLYTIDDGLAHNNVQTLHRASDGRIWVGTRGGGLSVFDGERFRNYTTAQGLSNRVETITEDNAGNVWIGTQNSGAVKIARDGLISFREADGLSNPEIISIFETNAGELCAIGSRWTINRYDGERFTAIRPRLPQRIVDSSSGRWMMLEDHAGEWWVATNEGLYRFPAVKQLEELARRPPKAVYTIRDGLADNTISRLFEDRHGDIWISSFNPPIMLTRWERTTNTFHRYGEADGLPGFNWANVLADDAGGNLWIGLHNGGLARQRGNRFEVFGDPDGVPRGLGQGLYRDRQDRLWFASSGGGACRIDDATAERPRFTTYTVRENISSNNLRSFTEDAYGNIYLGTARGVDRLDPRTNQVNHFSTADGLVKSEVTAAFRDRHDQLWFGTREGLSRFQPATQTAHAPPPVLIAGLRIGNASYPIPELGAKTVAEFELSANQNQIQVDFFSLAFAVGETIHYQYKLEGSAREWSTPADERSVTFANLAPGAYRFLVRGVNPEGLTSAQPATISFTILPPFYQRAWFLLLVVAVLAAAVHALYRIRLRRLLELERVRMRIATDLHDDIGAGLSQIAILSELMKGEAEDMAYSNDPYAAAYDKHDSSVDDNGGDPSRAGVTAPLTKIAASSRELVGSMSDIVWAINPQKDHLGDLVGRMRRFASDVLAASDIEFRFRTEGVEAELALGADVRREVFLIFKESINNICKHAACTEVIAEFKVASDGITLRIEDDGRGFDTSGNTEGKGLGGHGMSSMRARAERLGGTLTVTSEIGTGTTLTMHLPHKMRRWSFPRLRKRDG